MPEPSPRLSKILNNSVLLRYILLFVCGWLTILLINFFYGTIALFTASAIVAALLNYPVVWLSRYLPRGIAIAVTFIFALVILFGTIAGIGLEALNQGQGLLLNLKDALDRQDLIPFQDFLDRLDIGKLVGTLQVGIASGLNIVQGVFSSFFTVVFGVVISIYMLIDGERLWKSCLQLLPVHSRDRFASTFRRSFLGFIRGQMLLMLFLGVTVFIAFTLLGVKYSLILALIVGVIDGVPGIGATLAVSLATFLIFTSQGLTIAIKALIVCLILVQIQDNIIRPKVMGNALELNPVILFLSLFIGERVGGLLGVFLSIPIAGMISLWLKTNKEEAVETEIEGEKAEI